LPKAQPSEITQTGLQGGRPKNQSIRWIKAEAWLRPILSISDPGVWFGDNACRPAHFREAMTTRASDQGLSGPLRLFATLRFDVKAPFSEGIAFDTLKRLVPV